MNYIYEAISLPKSIWTGKAKTDYLEILNERGSKGWRFVGFSPTGSNPQGAKAIELIFEKQV